MPLEFRCIQCRKLLRVSDDAMGKKARCPDCGTIQETSGAAGTSPIAIPTPTSQSPFAGGQPSTDPPTNPFSERGAPQSAFGEATRNPYLAPQSAGNLPPASSDMIRAKVNSPATAMLVVSGLMAVIQVGGAAVLVVIAVSGNARIEDFVPSAVGLAIGLAVTSVTIYGSIKMRNMANYGMAMTAAVLSIIPCTTSCCIISIPVGIWSLVVLIDPQVKQAFR